MFIWFPYKTPNLSECQYNTPLLEVVEHSENSGDTILNSSRCLRPKAKTYH